MLPNKDDKSFLNMQGANPMRNFGPPPGPPPDMPPGGPPMSPDMMGGMPPGMPPGGPPMDMMGGPPMDEIMGEQPMPQSATVVTVEGGTVVIRDDAGKEHTLPVDAFPFPPTEGMQLVQATVIESTPEGVMVEVGPERITTEIPAEQLNMEFNPGDLFWMPAPPIGTGDMGMDMPPPNTMGM